MSARDIFHEYLLLSKTITLAFPSYAEMKVFRSGLHTAKRRLEEQAAKFGFEAGTEEQSICMELLLCQVDGTVTYKIWLGNKPKKPVTYSIMQVAEGPE